MGNTIVLGFSWYNQPESIAQVLEIINYFFTGIYSLEMIIKMISQKRDYFDDGWNMFDFLIVMSAWFGIFALSVFNLQIGPITTIIRSFRIARVLKLIKRAKNLQKILQTIVIALPELINVGALLLLFIFLFSLTREEFCIWIEKIIGQIYPYC